MSGSLIEGRFVPKVMAQLDRAPARFPHVTEGGRWTTSADGLWTGGFWAGQLWLLWRATGEARFRAALAPLVDRLAARKDAAEVDFDLGFLASYGLVLGHRLTGDDGLRQAALATADRLLDLVEPRGGVITHRYPERLSCYGAETRSTIIDVMMNLPLLWWAAAETGAEAYRTAALAHADRSLAWLLRPDGSTVQLADLDPATGECLRRDTINGLAADSCWSRGQAWAAYGFLLAARATGAPRYQEAFERCLRYVAARLPADGLPPWDFDAPPASRGVKDSSAAAILLAALRRARALERLPVWAAPLEQSLDAGLIAALAPVGQDGVLAQSCHRYRLGSGVGGASVWGDYFLLEALVGTAPI